MGVTRRDELIDIEKQLGKRPAQLKIITPPSDLLYLWELFISIWTVSDDRVLLSDIRSYAECYGIKLRPYEYDLIIRIEAARQWLIQQSYN